MSGATHGVQCFCEESEARDWPHMWQADLAFFFRHTLNPRNYGPAHDERVARGLGKYLRGDS